MWGNRLCLFLVERIGPDTALVYYHDTHVSINVKSIPLILDPETDQLILGAEDPVQGVQNVQSLAIATRTAGIVGCFTVEIVLSGVNSDCLTCGFEVLVEGGEGSVAFPDLVFDSIFECHVISFDLLVVD